RSVEVDVDRAGRFEIRLAVGGQTFDVLSVAQGPDYLVEVDGAVHRISGGEAGLVRAPAPAMVVTVSVAAGDEVAEGDVVAVVESMKLETSLRAPASGQVAEVSADDPRLLAGEARILQIFADVSALWRSRRVPGESQDDDEAAVDAEAARNPQEYMHAYLRSRDADAEGLPESFRIKLRRTLAHYGVDGLEPSPGLDPALYRIFLAHRRAAAYVPVVSELLQWRLDHPGSVSDDGQDDYR